MTDYFDVIDKSKTFEKRNKSITDYIKLEDSKPVKVQLLIPPAVGEIHKHWIQQGRTKLPVRCLGEGSCPICARNKSIEYDNKHPDFIRRDISYIANVVDLTPMKVCPNCEHVNDKAATKCANEECNKIIIDVDAQPIRMVRYLEGSKSFFNQLRDTINQTLNMLGLEKDDIPNIPFVINRSVHETNSTHTILPQPVDKDKVDAKQYMDKVFDYDKTGIHVNYDEMVMLMNGVAFKDILSKRNNKENPSTRKQEVDNLFG